MAQRRPWRKKAAPPRKKPSGKPQRKAAAKARAKPRAQTPRRTHLVYDFAEGNRDMKYLLGGKGANLAEMTNLGLPVPPGFTITTDACRVYMETGQLPSGLDEEVDTHLQRLEKKMKRNLGDPADPLLVSV